MRDTHFESEGEIISRQTIENSIDMQNAKAYRIICEREKVGGLVLRIDVEQQRGELMLLFVNPEHHNEGIGYSAWMAVEAMHPAIKVWETITPYFEKRNIHFYVTQCGFHIVEFFCSFHCSPDINNNTDLDNENEEDEMFRFEKIIRHL